LTACPDVQQEAVSGQALFEFHVRRGGESERFLVLSGNSLLFY
jgi:hypothetical protein